MSPPLKEQQTEKEVDATKGVNLKKLGNKAFQEKEHETAVEQYSLALLVVGDTLRIMLSNWALCALETVALGDAIAASVPSLRVGPGEKAIHRLVKALSFLGEYDLALLVIAGVMPGATHNLASLNSEIQKAQHLETLFRRSGLASDPNVSALVLETPGLLGNWIGPVETFMSKGKGISATLFAAKLPRI